MPDCFVNQAIDVWKRVGILWACSIEVNVIYTHPLFFVWFLHHYHIGKSSGVVNFSDELSHHQLGNLLL